MWILDHLGKAHNLDFYYRMEVTDWTGTAKIQGELVYQMTYAVIIHPIRDAGQWREISPRYVDKEIAEKALRGFVNTPTPSYFYNLKKGV